MNHARLSVGIGHLGGMGNNRRIFLTCFVVVVLSVVSWRVLCPPEPSFRGQPLSTWLRELGHLNVETGWWRTWEEADLSHAPVNVEAADAIRHIGSSSLPYLLCAINNKESAFKRKITGLLPSRLQKFMPAANLAEPRGQAVLAFAVLGNQAESVAPELAKALRENESCPAAALALSAIGPKGWALLTQAIGVGSLSNEYAASSAVWALGGQRAAVPGTIDVLESAVTNSTSTSGIVGMACWALGRIGQDKEHVVPFLIRVMQLPGRPALNWFAIVGLREFGTNATSAVPFLLQARQSQTNIAWTSALEKALRKIDPKGAAKGLYNRAEKERASQKSDGRIPMAAVWD